MFENVLNFFKKLVKKEEQETKSKETAKERLHLVLMQDRANVSADFLELMKQEIIEVIKKYIDVEEEEIDVRLKNKVTEDGTTGAPFLYANIPVMKIKNEMKPEKQKQELDTKPEPDNVGAASSCPKKEAELEDIKEDNPETVGADDPVCPEPEIKPIPDPEDNVGANKTSSSGQNNKTKTNTKKKK